MNLYLKNDQQKQFLLCALLLIIAYMLVFGVLLVKTDFLPYVMDNNESFSSLWHAYNLYHFDITKSAGLADEAFAYHEAAHAYAHTHQGNFPRLFAFLIYSLGARSIESQIAVTTFTVGIAAILMAFHFFNKIANPVFALTCCFLLITDYLLVAQWQVVTYRVWHEFFIFSSMLCVHRMVEGRRFWAVLSIINFACLFYYELIFVAFVSLSSALYAAYLCRSSKLLRLLGFWTTQGVGGIAALAILALQLYFYLGWEDLKTDAFLTFLARNHYQDGSVLLQHMRDFYESRNIVFWYNLEDGARYRTIGYFFGSLLYSELQIHTPLLATLSLIGLLVLLCVLAFDPKKSDINESNQTENHGSILSNAFGLVSSTQVRGAIYLIVLHFAHKYFRDDFGDLQMQLLRLMLVVLICGILVSGFWIRVRHAHRQKALRKSSIAVALLMLALLFPSIYWHVSSVPILFDQYSPFFFGYLLIYVFYLAWLPGWLLKVVGALRKGGTVQSRMMERASVLFLFLSFLFFYIILLGKNLILGTEELETFWFQPANPYYFILALLAALGSVYLVYGADRVLHREDESQQSGSLHSYGVKLKLSIFVLLAALLIAGSWRLYNPRYSKLWIDIADAALPVPLPHALVMLCVFLGCAAILAHRRVFEAMGINSVVKGCGVFALTGLLAYIIVYMLSPGYVFSGYRFRMTPFTAFHSVILLAVPVYVLLKSGFHFSEPIWRSFSMAPAGLSPTLPDDGDQNARGALYGRMIGLASVAASVMVLFYWLGIQLYYVRLIPPNHYAFLEKLTRAPYAGKTFVANTYAAPVAAKTGAWAYLDATLMSLSPEKLEALKKVDGRYQLVFDTTYIWFADRKQNPSYERPDYFMCIVVQSTSTAVEEFSERHGMGNGNTGCEANLLVQLARRGKGATVYPALELSEFDKDGSYAVGYERWAIVRLNWDK